MQKLGTPAWLVHAIMRDMSCIMGQVRIQDTGCSEPSPFEKGAKVGATEAPDLSKHVIEAAFTECVQGWKRDGIGFELDKCTGTARR